MKANCERRRGNYNESNLRKKEEISGKVTECEKLYCVRFLACGLVFVFSEENRQNKITRKGYKTIYKWCISL